MIDVRTRLFNTMRYCLNPFGQRQGVAFIGKMPCQSPNRFQQRHISLFRVSALVWKCHMEQRRTKCSSSWNLEIDRQYYKCISYLIFEFIYVHILRNALLVRVIRRPVCQSNSSRTQAMLGVIFFFTKWCTIYLLLCVPNIRQVCMIHRIAPN